MFLSSFNPFAVLDTPNANNSLLQELLAERATLKNELELSLKTSAEAENASNEIDCMNLQSKLQDLDGVLKSQFGYAVNRGVQSVQSSQSLIDEARSMREREINERTL